MKRRLLLILATVMMLITMPVLASEEIVDELPALAGDFKDVQDKHWAKAQIMLAVAKGYVSGFPDGTFRPDEPVSRAQFIRMLVDALKLPHVEQGQPWYQPYVAAVLETGIHKAEDFKTDYDKSLTRLEMARLSVRATELDGLFEDDSWMVYATEKGIIHGVGNGVLQPEGLSTRAQAVAVIERVLAIVSGQKLPTDEKAIETAHSEAYHHNLYLWGFTDVAKLPLTIADASGFKVTINSMYAYNREDSKPIVHQYELYETRFENKVPKQIWQYDLDGFTDDYTLFHFNVTLQNDGEQEQATDFYDLDRDYSFISHKGSFPITPPGDLSELRRSKNRPDYGYMYRLKKGESYTTNLVYIFKRGYVADFMNFSVLRSYEQIATIPSDKAR